MAGPAPNPDVAQLRKRVFSVKGAENCSFPPSCTPCSSQSGVFPTTYGTPTGPGSRVERQETNVREETVIRSLTCSSKCKSVPDNDTLLVTRGNFNFIPWSPSPPPPGSSGKNVPRSREFSSELRKCSFLNTFRLNAN